VWANAIVSHFSLLMYSLLTFERKLRKVTDYNQVPLGSNYFGAKHRLGFSKSKPAPVTVPDTDNMSAGSAASTYQSSVWNGHPYYQPLQNPPHHYYGHPYQGMASYDNHYYSPGFAPLNPTAFPPTPIIHSESNQVQSGPSGPSQGNAVVPKQLTPALSAPLAAVKAFCDKYDLGDEEREGLCKLGFRIGDVLDTVTESEWAISGLPPLHRRRILLAWKAEQSV
jgi:hypothetical protein